MDKAALVDHDLRIGNHVISLLAGNGVAVQEAFWVYVSQVEEWRLVVSSPFVDQKGTRQTYIAVSNILNKSPLISEIPVRRISVLSPRDPVLHRLKDTLGIPAGPAFSPSGRIGQYVLDEAFMYGGSLHVFQSRRRDGTLLFHVTYAPFKGPGGAIPVLTFVGDQELRDFLSKKIGIREREITKAREELQLAGTFDFPIHLRTGDLRRLGLLPPPRSPQEQPR